MYVLLFREVELPSLTTKYNYFCIKNFYVMIIFAVPFVWYCRSLYLEFTSTAYMSLFDMALTQRHKCFLYNSSKFYLTKTYRKK